MTNQQQQQQQQQEPQQQTHTALQFMVLGRPWRVPYAERWFSYDEQDEQR